LEKNNPTSNPESEENSNQKDSSDSKISKDNSTYKDNEYKINNFEELPTHLQKILVDLAENYEVIEIKETSIHKKKKRFKRLLSTILKNYSHSRKEKNFVQDLYFTKNKKISFIFWRYTQDFAVEEKESPVSTPTQKNQKKISHSKGEKGHSHRSSSSNKRRSFREGDFAIIEESPLSEVVDKVKKPQREMGITIHPEKNIHGLRLMYLFGGVESAGEPKSQDQLQRESAIYDKMVDYFKQYYENKDGNHWFEKRGAMWPKPLYIDETKGIEAHFTIQMHKGGRFIIPIKRDMNFKQFINEFVIVFSKFLSPDEVELVLKWLFEQGGKENKYIHEAHAIDPDEIVEKRLNGAIVHVKIFGPEENSYHKVYVDKSKEFEFEGEGDAVKVQDTMDIITTPEYIGGSIASMNSKLASLDRHNTHALVVQQELKEDQHFYFHELDTKLNQQYQVIKTIPDLHEENLVISKNILGNLDRFNQNQQIIGNSLGDVVKLTNNQTDLFDQQITQVEDNILKNTKQDTDLILASLSSMKEELKEEFDNLRKAVIDQIDSSHTEFKHNLYLVLRAIKQIPGLTSKELIDLLKKELNVSQTTIYKYFNRLQKEGFIESEKYHDHRKGRPSRIFSISHKIKNLIKKI